MPSRFELVAGSHPAVLHQVTSHSCQRMGCKGWSSLSCVVELTLSHCVLWHQVYQRQLSKEGLQSLVNNASTKKAGGAEGGGSDFALSSMSVEELRDLFTLRSETRSDTYDSMCCR